MIGTKSISINNIQIGTTQGQLIVPDISFNIQRHTIMGIFGESGAGKTIIGRAIASKLPWGIKILKGSILYLDEVHPITMIPQLSQAALPPLMTVSKFIKCVLKWNKQESTDEHLKQVLNQVGFPKSLNPQKIHPHQLSGGLAFRTAIAAGLATSPKTLILDEPTSGLDPISARKLATILHSLSTKQKITIIIITHDISWATNICIDCLAIKNGRNIYEGDMPGFINTSDDYLRKMLHNT